MAWTRDSGKVEGLRRAMLDVRACWSMRNDVAETSFQLPLSHC